MPYYWKAKDNNNEWVVLAEFQEKQDAEDALDFKRTMTISLPNSEPFTVSKEDVVIFEQHSLVDFMDA
jgi:hypothetical protein|tara:strand:- start:120 stop:323 length:204 start_codon:yes stop_codon:yes gene_type:complete